MRRIPWHAKATRLFHLVRPRHTYRGDGGQEWYVGYRDLQELLTRHPELTGERVSAHQYRQVWWGGWYWLPVEDRTFEHHGPVRPGFHFDGAVAWYATPVAERRASLTD